MTNHFNLLKNKDFFRLYLSGSVSEFGSLVTETAIMLLLFNLSGNNNSYLGLSRGVFLVFITFGSLLGGPIGELPHKKITLIICELTRLIAIFLLIFTQSITIILIINATIAFFTGIFNPTRQAYINLVVTKANIKQANSLYGTTLATLYLICPFIGVLLYNHFHGIIEISVIDACTYFFAILILSQIKSPAKPSPKLNMASSFKSGIKYLNERKDIQSLLINTSIRGLCIGILIPLLLPYTLNFLKLTEQHYAYLLGSFGAGGIIGGIVSNYLGNKFKMGKIIIIIFILESILMPVWLWSSIFIINIIFMTIWGTLVFIRIPSQLNLISNTIEQSYLSRVHSVLNLAFIIPNILGSLLVMIMGNNLSAFELLNFIAFSTLIITLLNLITSGSRKLYSSY